MNIIFDFAIYTTIVIYTTSIIFAIVIIRMVIIFDFAIYTTIVIYTTSISFTIVIITIVPIFDILYQNYSNTSPSLKISIFIIFEKYVWAQQSSTIKQNSLVSFLSFFSCAVKPLGNLKLSIN